MIELLLLVSLSIESAPLSPLPEGLTPPALCQEKGEKEEKEEAKKKEKDKEKAPPIPELPAYKKEKARRLLKLFKNTNADKRRKYQDQMIAIGRGAIPFLLEEAETKHPLQAEGVARCLAALLDVRDRTILDKLSQSKNKAFRAIAAAKYAAANDPRLKDKLKFFLKDKEAAVRLEAGLGLIKLGDASGIGEIILKVAEAGKNEKAKKPLLKDVGLVKGKAYDSLFRPYIIAHKDFKVRIACIEVIVAVGDKRFKKLLGQALSDDEREVQAAAVNALRRLVNGEEPITFANIIDLIKTVDQWKKELGLIR